MTAEPITVIAIDRYGRVADRIPCEDVGTKLNEAILWAYLAVRQANAIPPPRGVTQ